MDDRPIVIGLGELLWDCFEDSRRPGGAPANVAFQANQLGCLGIVCSRIGQDESGQELAEFLESQGLLSRYLQFDPDRPTGTVTVKMAEGNHPVYTIHEKVAWDAIEFSPDWQQCMQSASAICFGSLAQRTENGHQTVQICLSSASESCLIVYDVNLRQNYYSRDVIESSLKAADVVKLNHEEVGAITEALKLNVGSVNGFADQVQNLFEISLVVITRGENGCLLISPDETIEVAGHKIDVADAVGAGDAFTAGLISALLRKWPLSLAGEFANHVGATVASRSGAMPDLKAEFAALRADFETRVQG